MSLLTVNISKVKRLSLRDVKLPAPKSKVLKIERLETKERPPTAEEIAYSKLVAINPNIEELVNRLNLVSYETNEKINKVELRAEDYKAEEIDKERIFAFTSELITGERSYSKREIIDKLRDKIIDTIKAERGFYLMLKAGAIETTLNKELYYLKGSTPF